MPEQISKTGKLGKRKELPAIVTAGAHDLIGITNSGQSNFDRKAEEMKAFLKRNPAPKEFLK
ncbi:hypothetical protein [Dyadobacter luticola]|uniref:Uncharacterized protein n=1 Tax=Dyadobacter luticola TaxID=1979387 RepID=A0A5R9KXV2_9BACT|nr:hypothetical protein [Dyadobacter luticola]TLV00991.1 hypothetical protein FEN17_16130 [Dyadobacter luticola]